MLMPPNAPLGVVLPQAKVKLAQGEKKKSNSN